jgi:hypothetical protein
MNIEQGLRRISAVWWGLWGALAAFMLGVALFGSGSDRGVIGTFGAIGLVAAYMAHRLTCWVIAGFFAPRS